MILDREGIDTTGLNSAQILAHKKIFAKVLNINKILTKFKETLKNERVYRIPLCYFTNLGKVNFPTKINCRIKLHLEKEMKRLFESRKLLAKDASIPVPDAKIILTKTPFVQYDQILLDKNFRQYLETIMVSKNFLRMGTQKPPLKKTYEINFGQDSIDIGFLGVRRQFYWLEISLVYNKNDTHTTIYDSYNSESAAKRLKSLKLTNFTEIYSLTNEKKYDLDNLTQSHLLYKQFVVWSCNGSSVAPPK